MSKRPSIVDLNDFTVKPTVPAAPAPTPAATVVSLQQTAQEAAAAPPQPVAPAAVAPIAPDMMRTSIYIPRKAHRRLKEIALTEDVKVNDLIAEGIDAVIAKRGHVETAARKPKR